MDGDPPPPSGLNYYPQNWSNVPVEESNPLEHHEHLEQIGFTTSQTQMLESIITNDQLYVDNVNPLHHEFQLEFGNEHGSIFTELDYPVHCPQQQAPALSLSPSSSSNGIPSLESWCGNLNYLVEFNKAQDRTKATPWIFSQKLEKLFVQLDKACPVNFKLNIPPVLFSNYQVRGQIVYSKAEDFHDSVERCINHQQKDTVTYPHTAHVLRCDDTSATYIDHEHNRHSVIVGLKQPAPGSQHVTLCFRFMCLSSCIGSLNRRPTKLILTLETVSGVEVGRYAADVRICSCPGRDIKTEEEKYVAEGSNGANSDLIPIQMPIFKSKTKKRKLTAPTTSSNHSSSVNDNDQIYHLNREIRGKAQYEMIRDVVDRMLALVNTPKTENPSPENQLKRFKEEFP